MQRQINKYILSIDRCHLFNAQLTFQSLRFIYHMDNTSWFSVISWYLKRNHTTYSLHSEKISTMLIFTVLKGFLWVTNTNNIPYIIPIIRCTSGFYGIQHLCLLFISIEMTIDTKSTKALFGTVNSCQKALFFKVIPCPTDTECHPRCN